MPTSDYDQYVQGLKKLDNGLIGSWRQGSTVLGYADEHSDIDSIFVWTTLPDSSAREQIAKSLDIEQAAFRERPDKGMDSFRTDGIFYGQSHILVDQLLAVYPNLLKSDITPSQLWRLGGLSKGRIIDDTKNTLADYQQSLKVTAEITEKFMREQKPWAQRELKKLKVAASRNEPITFIEHLYNSIEKFHGAHYMKYGLWPMACKWVLQEAEKYGWQNAYVELVRTLKAPWKFDDVLKQAEGVFSETMGG